MGYRRVASDGSGSALRSTVRAFISVKSGGSSRQRGSRTDQSAPLRAALRFVSQPRPPRSPISPRAPLRGSHPGSIPGSSTLRSAHLRWSPSPCPSLSPSRARSTRLPLREAVGSGACYLKLHDLVLRRLLPLPEDLLYARAIHDPSELFHARTSGPVTRCEDSDRHVRTDLSNDASSQSVVTVV